MVGLSGLAVCVGMVFVAISSPRPDLTGPGPGVVEPSDDATGPRRIIDTHSHLIGPDAWPLIESVMDAHGIERFVNLSGGSPRRGMTSALELAQASRGRVLNAMTIDWQGFGEVPWGDAVAAELSLAVENYGFVGLKVSKALGLFVTDFDGALVAVNDPRLYPIWQRAGDLGVPVFIHTGDPAAFWQDIGPDNERYAELLAHPGWSFAGPEYPPRDELLAQRDAVFEAFPNTRFVAVHFGNNPEDLAYVEGLLERFPNVYVDLAARVPEIGRHPPERVRELFTRYSTRILFATDIALGVTQSGREVLMLGSTGSEPDTPDRIPAFFEAHWRFLETNDQGFAHPTPIQGDWTIDGIGLPPEVLERVYYQNAFELLGLESL